MATPKNGRFLFAALSLAFVLAALWAAAPAPAQPEKAVAGHDRRVREIMPDNVPILRTGAPTPIQPENPMLGYYRRVQEIMYDNMPLVLPVDKWPQEEVSIVVSVRILADGDIVAPTIMGRSIRRPGSAELEYWEDTLEGYEYLDQVVMEVMKKSVPLPPRPLSLGLAPINLGLVFVFDRQARENLSGQPKPGQADQPSDSQAKPGQADQPSGGQAQPGPAEGPAAP